MAKRLLYEMTDAELASITDTTQAQAREAWRLMAIKYGFKVMTVIPVARKDDHFFMAEPKDPIQ